MEASQHKLASGSISTNDIIDILMISIRQQYSVKEANTKIDTIKQNVRFLFEQDYVCEYISNTNGELSLTYPSQILVPVTDKWSEVPSSKFQWSTNVRDCCIQSRFARCRSRLVVPAILVNGKYICRSATLSSWGEIYPRFSMNIFVDSNKRRSTLSTTDLNNNINDIEQPQQQSIFDKLRGADIDLLKIFDVGSIINLMVQKKHAMLGMKITASEKLDKYNRYKAFQMILLPYPGCEHFRELALRQYNGEFLFYDWSHSKNDALVEVPIHLLSRVNTDWIMWQSWNTLHMTQNYFKILLRHLEIDKQGILIHCLSGWDRTPLFISLLRLSLWADGYIHQSLTVEEILYLTLAYDWYLFGHPLPERLSRGEEILSFTFIILPYLVGNEFIFRPTNTSHQQSSTLTSTGITTDYLAEPQINNSNVSYMNLIDDSIGNMHRNSYQSKSNDAEEKKQTIRTEKLLSVFQLFNTCYRIVVPENSTLSNNRSRESDISQMIKNLMLRR